MFNYIEVKNFRKLRNNRYEFVPGLNAIRGANEQGKSTLLEAMGYAMQGVEALRESLDAVVTWGEKESTLKVELGMTINGTEVVITRSKAGAEIKVGGKLCATGQKEVTRFVDGLLGAAPKMASKLMLAKQSALRGALDDGPKATAELIEQLSNFSLIDEVIQLVQENLPCGSPVGLEQQAKTLAGQLEAGKPGELLLGSLPTDLAEAQSSIDKERQELGKARAELGPAQEAAKAHSDRLQRYNSARQAVAAQEQLIRQSQDSLAGLNVVSSTSEDDLKELRRLQAEQAQLSRVLTARRELDAFRLPETQWEGNRASFEAEIRRLFDVRESLKTSHQGYQTEAAGLAALKITGTACGLCGKDLSAIPEVVAKNTEIDRRLAELQQLSAERQQAYAEADADLTTLKQIDGLDQKLRLLLAKHAEYVRVLDTHVPAAWEWLSPAPANAPLDYTPRIRAAEQELQRAAQAQGQKAALEGTVRRAQEALAAAQKMVDELGPQISGDRSTGLAADLQTKVSYHERRLAELKALSDRLEAEIRHRTEMHAAQVKAYEQLQANLEAVNKQLEELALNNVLLKKLRGARPKVADKLWGVVLPTIGTYFSRTRGVQSVVSRDDDGFKVDGKPVAGLSGSALDALGLGIRIALVKTFLPNNDFLVLDEPAAACDDGRETNMLGMLTTAGFEQVLLVTHSQLADSFSSQVISV